MGRRKRRPAADESVINSPLSDESVPIKVQPMARSTIRKDALRSRRAILDAAHQLLSNGGDASFAEIAYTAGVGQATVYRHFENRQDLIAALAEEGMARLEARVAEAP